MRRAARRRKNAEHPNNARFHHQKEAETEGGEALPETDNLSGAC